MLEPRDVPRVVEELSQQAHALPGAQPIVVAPYLSPRTRGRLVIKGVNYWDAASNIHLEMPKPVIVIGMTGADKNPDRTPRSLQTLRGQAAARAVRALCDLRPPYGIRELATRCDTPAPTISRVVDLLEREAIVERASPRGQIVQVDWEALLRRWVQDYDFVKSNQTSSFLEPRGLPVLLEKLQRAELQYAITGTLAADAQGAAVSAPRLAAVFVENNGTAGETLKLRPAESGGNVLLAEPYNPVVFERTRDKDGLVYAAPSQVVADLLTGPGRGPADGEALLKWMKESEGAWRGA